MNSEWRRPETAASVTSVSREMGRPRAFYQLTARSPAWRRHVTLVTCHVSMLILQTLSTRLGNYWSVRHSTGMVTWLLSYMLQLALCSLFILVTFCTSTPYLECLHTYRIVVYGGQCQWNASTFVTALSVFKMWPGEVLCCLLFQKFRFLVLSTDQAASAVELAILTLSYTYINIHNIEIR